MIAYDILTKLSQTAVRKNKKSVDKDSFLWYLVKVAVKQRKKRIKKLLTNTMTYVILSKLSRKTITKKNKKVVDNGLKI